MPIDMEPRLTRAEYWLLNLVVYGSYPINLLSATNPGEIFNRTGHGLSPERLKEVLWEMFEKEWLEAHIPFIENPKPEPVNRSLIEAILDDQGPRYQFGKSLYYRLTSLGAAIWEAFASPSWDRYLDKGWFGHAGEAVEMIGATEWRIQQYFSLIHLDGIIATPNTIQWDEIRPWQCTYWKELPVGYRVRFVFKEDQPTRAGTCNFDARRLDHLTKWYDWQ